ncbi:unnamed protein product [Bodo saltans]|uniref:Membrane-associated protein n=1 Tax=Bodo saltans TaxID=75058 RepID=A0A0S4KJV0_BODSA|nr:unnamed protein product [Bodo saltans]|eukprot:CUI14826.1 unnamed protein product [Bodo saltans]
MPFIFTTQKDLREKMHRFVVLALLALLCLVGCSHSATITQQWYTDAQCTQGENTVQVNEGQCYLDAADYAGMSWNCVSGGVVAFVYNYADENCSGAPIAKKPFAQGQCTGPVYNNLYLIVQGC